MASVAEPFLQDFRFRLAFGVTYCEVLYKHYWIYLWNATEISHKIQNPLNSKGTCRNPFSSTENMQRASHFRVGCSYKLSTIFFKAETTSIMCSFPQKLCRLNFVLVFRAAVLF